VVLGALTSSGALGFGSPGSGIIFRSRPPRPTLVSRNRIGIVRVHDHLGARSEPCPALLARLLVGRGATKRLRRGDAAFLLWPAAARNSGFANLLLRRAGRGAIGSEGERPRQEIG
jgi:hypothetical protein